MKHASLFSGIGGFDLAAYWMGWENVFQVEIDSFCRKVLAKNFPNTIRHEDIKEFNGQQYRGTIDVLSGGFPCQPFSVAGKRAGKEDDRYLWEEMLRVIREVQPTFVVGENVPGIIGMALDHVLADLENQGYTTETFIVPACAKNAWHRRDRVWLVAYSNSIGSIESGKELKSEQFNKNEPERGIFTNTNDTRCEKQRDAITARTELFAPQCSSWWQAEPSVGRVVDGLPNRVDRLKGLGNAIVPQIALEIFKVLDRYYSNFNQ